MFDSVYLFGFGGKTYLSLGNGSAVQVDEITEIVVRDVGGVMEVSLTIFDREVCFSHNQGKSILDCLNANMVKIDKKTRPHPIHGPVEMSEEGSRVWDEIFHNQVHG